MNVISNLYKKGSAIAEGFTRYALNIRTTIMVYREENYCKRCPVAYKKGKYTGFCNKSKGGCGCHAGAKSSQNNEFCPKGFWGNDWFKPDEFEEFLITNPVKKNGVRA